MALTDDNSMVMPVQPLYGGGYGNNGNGLFGGTDSWLGILFLIALLGGGWGGMGFGGFGGFGGMLGMDMWGGGFGLYPWLNNSQNINDGFRTQQLATQVGNIQNSITSGFGDVQLGIAGVNQNICQTGAGITNAINNGFANTNLGMCNGFNGVNTAINSAQNAIATQMYSNEIANLNRSFAEQTANTQGFNSVTNQLAQCCCDNKAGLADVKYTIATENCADRAAISDALRDVIAANTASTQRILDQLCQDKIDAKNDTIAQLRQELMFSRGQASQDVQTAQLLANNNAQTALFQQGLNNEVDALYNRLSSCPIPSVPVYGRQNIFTCNNNNNTCGCGCGGF